MIFLARFDAEHLSCFCQSASWGSLRLVLEESLSHNQGTLLWTSTEKIPTGPFTHKQVQTLSRSDLSQPKPKTCHKTSLRLRANSDTPLERAADCRTLRFVLLSQPSKRRTIHQSKTCCRISKSRTKKSGTSRTNYAEEERVWRKGVPTTGEDTQPRHSRQCLRTRQNDG